MGVIIYTSDICAPCKATKSWLTAHNISYTEKNISDESNRMELIGKGYQSTPVTLVQNGDNETYIVGFNTKKLEEDFSK